MRSRRVVLSGCSGGGKSSLLAELARRGFATVEEPGRRILREEGAGSALPWVNPRAFAQRAVAVSLADLAATDAVSTWIFFDRGLIDAVAALHHTGGRVDQRTHELLHSFHPQVFLTPPWPEIYVTDADRRHGITEAIAEYQRLLTMYRSLGYEVIVLPKAGVPDRADRVLEALGGAPPSSA